MSGVHKPHAGGRSYLTPLMGTLNLIMTEKCAICGCPLHRTKNTYARPTVEGRSHASNHHYIPERFFGRSKNRRGTQREKIFEICPWDYEGEGAVFCYDCHEELIHNPVFLPEDIRKLADLVQQRCLDEVEKPETRSKIAGRIRLLHEVIEAGLSTLSEKEANQ